MPSAIRGGPFYDRYFFTLYMIPHNALIPELIQDGPVRVNAYTISSFFFVTGSALGYVSPLIVSAFKGACIMYYVTSLMGLAETYSVLILAISIAGSLLMYPLVNKFAKKRGKKLPIILGCIVFSAAEIVICFSDMLPGNRLVLACVFALFVSFPFAVLNVLPGAMMADIIQYDTVTTGVNQEGIFGAARSFIVKMGNSLAIMIVPSLIVTGAAAGENVGVLGLKLTAVAGAVFCILAIFVLLRYRESEVLAVIAGARREGRHSDRQPERLVGGERPPLRSASGGDDPLPDGIQKGRL